MPVQEGRILLIKAYEETHDADITREIFWVNRNTVCAIAKNIEKQSV